jgi:hypothetical protein
VAREERKGRWKIKERREEERGNNYPTAKKNTDSRLRT